jgi:hypothetical protein
MFLRMNFPRLAITGAVVVAVIAFLERVMAPAGGGTLLLNMTFWLALAEGSVALMAAAEIVHGRWHKPVMTRMLAAQWMIPFVGLLFLVLTTKLSIYPWIDEHGLWLNRTFFIVRHLAALVVVLLVARRFTALALKGRRQARKWAVVYILLFVTHQSMVGFEWVMSLEKPWFSTLLGAWFAVDSFQSGIVTGAFLLYSLRSSFDDRLRHVQKSIGGLMFGFATFWAYFYFSQLIVIWYGNLPEEVGYLSSRISYHTSYWWLARLIFGLCWVLPFGVLLGRKPKTVPIITVSVGALILAGFFLEKWLMIHPVAPVNWALATLEMATLLVLFGSIMKSGDALIPPLEAEVSEGTGRLEVVGGH